MTDTSLGNHTTELESIAKIWFDTQRQSDTKFIITGLRKITDISMLISVEIDQARSGILYTVKYTNKEGTPLFRTGDKGVIEGYLIGLHAGIVWLLAD